MAIPAKQPRPSKDNPLAETSLGRRLEAARLRKGLSRARLSKQLQVSSQALYAWERNAALPKVDVLDKAAQLLGYTIDELLHGRSALARLEERVAKLEQAGARGK